jgi:hypothetical protein
MRRPMQEFKLAELRKVPMTSFAMNRGRGKKKELSSKSYKKSDTAPVCSC